MWFVVIEVVLCWVRCRCSYVVVGLLVVVLRCWRCCGLCGCGGVWSVAAVGGEVQELEWRAEVEELRCRG